MLFLMQFLKKNMLFLIPLWHQQKIKGCQSIEKKNEVIVRIDQILTSIPNMPLKSGPEFHRY